MSEQFEVRPADLLVHGGHVDAIADQVAQAKAAGQAVQAGVGAYGKLCMMVPVMLSAMQTVLIDEIGDSAGVLRGTGDKLRATADEYGGTDRAQSDAILRIGSGL